MWSLSLSKYLIILYPLSFFLWWWEMREGLHDEMKQDVWCRYCDVRSSYHWPSDENSEGRSSASGLQLTTGKQNPGKWNHGCGRTHIKVLKLYVVHTSKTFQASELNGVFRKLLHWHWSLYCKLPWEKKIKNRKKMTKKERKQAPSMVKKDVTDP